VSASPTQTQNYIQKPKSKAKPTGHDSSVRTNHISEDITEHHYRLDIIRIQPRHHLWLCAVRGCRRTATELSRLPPRKSGTVCHITSRMHSHCLFSAVVWRLISSAAVFVDYIVVPAKWHSSLRTH